MFSPDIQSEIAIAAAAEARLQDGWPAAIPLRLWRQSAWYELPYFFLPAFPSLSPAAVRPLALFCRLFASSIFVHDPLADRGLVAHEAAASSLRIMAMQFEAYRALHTAFPPGAALWDRLRGYLADYAAACMEEHGVSGGARPWHDYTEDVAVRVAIGKSGVSRAIVAGLAELAHDEALLEPVVASLDQFNVACQLWDDLKDWRDDLQHGMPSLLLSRVLPERPSKSDVAATDRIGRELYYGGHASYVLDLALASLDAADQLKRLVPELPWYRLVEVTRAKLLETLRDLRRIIDRNVQHASEPPQLSPPAGEGPPP